MGIIVLDQTGRLDRITSGTSAPRFSALEGASTPDVCEYLHNYGVAFLCANEPERATEKLRSAYRIQENQATLETLGLAGTIVEWSLLVEVDQQPEVKMLIAQDPTLTAN